MFATRFNFLEAPDACYATNEVAQCNVCSVGWSDFVQRGVGFVPAMSLSTPGENLEFSTNTLKVRKN